jgi:5-methyltetrahydrofolate--homocysteine methyltransferase
MGSMLAARGLVLRNTGEANLAHPDDVVAVHREYRQAGADVLQTNSFVANRRMLAHAGLGDRAAEVQAEAARLCRAAAGDACFVAAGGGPTGALLEPLGDLPRADAVAIYREQYQVMLAEDVDFVLLETFEAIDELEAAIEGVRAAGCTLPIAATASFSHANGRTMMGHDGATVAKALDGLGVEIIGANCGDPGGLLLALRQMAEVTDRPLMAQANAGVPHVVGGQTIFDGTPADSAALAVELVALGVRIVGGCCGTTPEHIRAIAAAVGGAG